MGREDQCFLEGLLDREFLRDRAHLEDRQVQLDPPVQQDRLRQLVPEGLLVLYCQRGRAHQSDPLDRENRHL